MTIDTKHAKELARIIRTANDYHIPGNANWDEALAEAVIAAGWSPMIRADESVRYVAPEAYPTLVIKNPQTPSPPRMNDGTVIASGNVLGLDEGRLYTVSDLELEAIRARADKATPGPWSTPGDDTIGQWGIYDSDWTIATAAAYSHNQPYSDKPDARGPGYIDTNANAEFIAHARADIPALLAEVESLRAKLESAPHAEFCHSRYAVGFPSRERHGCDCWKSGSTT